MGLGLKTSRVIRWRPARSPAGRAGAPSGSSGAHPAPAIGLPGKRIRAQHGRFRQNDFSLHPGMPPVGHDRAGLARNGATGKPVPDLSRMPLQGVFWVAVIRAK